MQQPTKPLVIRVKTSELPWILQKLREGMVDDTLPEPWRKFLTDAYIYLTRD